MARIRSIKPEYWSDRSIARQLSRDARLLYIALWNFSDEHGRLPGDPRWVKGNCLPYDDDLGPEAVEQLLKELAAAGKVIGYEADGDPYLFLRTWPGTSGSRPPKFPAVCQSRPAATNTRRAHERPFPTRPSLRRAQTNRGDARTILNPACSTPRLWRANPSQTRGWVTADLASPVDQESLSRLRRPPRGVSPAQTSTREAPTTRCIPWTSCSLSRSRPRRSSLCR